MIYINFIDDRSPGSRLILDGVGAPPPGVDSMAVDLVEDRQLSQFTQTLGWSPYNTSVAITTTMN